MDEKKHDDILMEQYTAIKSERDKFETWKRQFTRKKASTLKRCQILLDRKKQWIGDLEREVTLLGAEKQAALGATTKKPPPKKVKERRRVGQQKKN